MVMIFLVSLKVRSKLPCSLDFLFDDRLFQGLQQRAYEKRPDMRFRAKLIWAFPAKPWARNMFGLGYVSGVCFLRSRLYYTVAAID